NKNVLDAIRKIKRELFIPEEFMDQAYTNHPLYIGYGQTISQPYTVAFMVELLELKKGQKVLEIGAGSGYNAAVMSYLVGDKGKIITTEIIHNLTENAKKNLKKLEIKNVEVIHKDGSRGYEEQMPYDRIIVTAATPDIKNEWIEQLKNEGILVLPLENHYSSQTMIKIKKSGDKLIEEAHGYFKFVPLRTDKNK
ncbi:MAG: protein-L-isoaspartate(D-aspartate) O-methyltransferase, partial [Nanoarchaeota archaeon]